MSIKGSLAAGLASVLAGVGTVPAQAHHSFPATYMVV